MHSILASTCHHHLRHSHTLPYTSSSPFDFSSPFCASCTFHQDLASKLAEAETLVATFAPHLRNKKHGRALDTRNRLKALQALDREWRRLREDPGKPTLGSDGEAVRWEDEGRYSSGVGEGTKFQVEEPQELKWESGPTTTKPALSVPQHSPHSRHSTEAKPTSAANSNSTSTSTSKAGLRTTFLPSVEAPLPEDVESTYRRRGAYWRPGSLYTPGTWAEPSGEGWLETSKMAMEWEKEEAPAPPSPRRLRSKGRKEGERDKEE